MGGPGDRSSGAAALLGQRTQPGSKGLATSGRQFEGTPFDSRSRLVNVADMPYQVIRWTTEKGRACAAMVPPGRDLTEAMRAQFSAVADETPVAEGEHPQFHFTVTFDH